MPSYKLTYFNLRGRAEVARWILAYAGVEYDDHRIIREDWPAMKPTTPFGGLPLLEVDGVSICQSDAINRYLANQHGLAGKSPIEKAQVDMVVGCFGDVLSQFAAIMKAEPEKKAELVKKFADEVLPEGLKKMEKLLEGNNGGNGFFVGDSVTYADFAVTHGLSMTSVFEIDPHLENFPKLKALTERVQGLPQIADWIKKRPVTPM